MKTLQTNYNPDVLTCLANLSNDEVFTPPNLVNNMLDLLPAALWSNPNATFLDPVSKSGVFLREIAKRLMIGLTSKIPDKQKRINHIFENQLYGIAITELTALLSRRSVYCSKTANSRYAVCETFDNEQGNIRYERMQHTWDTSAGSAGKCTQCGASQEVYDRGDEAETYAYNFIHTETPAKLFTNQKLKKGQTMKFDVIIGNPPYQLNVGVEKENYAIPIFQKFIEQAKKLNPRYLTMIIPSRWFTGGRGLDEFRNEMFNDFRIRKIVDYIDARECFNGVDVPGGILYFLWDKEYNGKCEFVSNHNGKTTIMERQLNEFLIFPRLNEAISIIYKVINLKEYNLSNQISSQTPFGLYTNYKGKKEKFENSIAVFSSSGIVYCSKEEVTRNKEWIDKWKVTISKASSEHAGQADKQGKRKVLSMLKLLPPQTICTQSYLVAGLYDNEKTAINYISYLNTKFARFLLQQGLSSQDISKDKFLFVPVQDFSEPWTDEKLYKKYGLTEEEIAFIESMIRPMSEQ
ncbi:MAG: Eco57I restriction-modification methylase domain-containing protein [Chitinophagales bacterium]|nr:Eco57I restriction-modification methylase domain-containing protein [Chitinophagales bacterium]